MVREYGGDHIDLSGARVEGHLIGKVEHHHHHPVSRSTSPLGRRLGDLTPADAHTFEVHEVADPTGGDDLPPLPPYLYRPDVDDPLRAAVRDARSNSGLVLLVGGSSVGKTRACWEAVHAELPPDWRLWHPLSPTRPEALAKALRANRVAPHTVVWLNEAQFYLREPEVLDALQGLLSDTSRGPVLVLGSLWPEYWRDLLDGTSTGRQSRLLLNRARDITVADSFTAAELRANEGLTRDDPRLIWALREGDQGQVTQALSGALDLIRRYRHGTPSERAVLDVVMDASRLNRYRYPLPADFVRAAAPGYLSPTELSRLPKNWFTAVAESLTRRGPGTPGPLIPRPDRKRTRYRLPDYLEEYGREHRRHLCPPASFWEALSGPSGRIVYGLNRFRQPTEDRLLLRHADATLRNSTSQLVLSELGEVLESRARLRTRGGDLATAERLATDAALTGRPDALLELVDIADQPALTRAAFALLQQTESTDRVVEEILLRFHPASQERRQALVRILDEVAGADGLRAMVGLLRPLRDRAGIRLCLEQVGPEEAETAEAEQSSWEAVWDRRIDQAIEAAKAGDRNPLDGLLPDDPHPLQGVVLGEIARRCVSAEVYEPVLELVTLRRGPASPRSGEGWPTHPELLEAFSTSRDPRCLIAVAKAATSAKAWDISARFLELAARAGADWRDLDLAMEALALSGRTAVVSRLLAHFDDFRATKLALRLCLRRGDLEGAERLAFPENVEWTFDHRRQQNILVRHLRRRGDTATAERLARHATEQGKDAQASFDLAELLNERGLRAEAVTVLSAHPNHKVVLEEVVGCLLTEPGGVDVAERMRNSETPGWDRSLLSFLSWWAEAAGDGERARVLRPHEGELEYDEPIIGLKLFGLHSDLWDKDEHTHAANEARELLHHLRHGTPLTLARHLAEQTASVPGLTLPEMWAADQPAGKMWDFEQPAREHPPMVRFRVHERLEGRQHLGILLAWTSQLYRIRGDRVSAEELEELSLRISGSGAIPALVRIHLGYGDDERVRALIGRLGTEATRSADDFDRSRPSEDEEDSLRHSQEHSYSMDTKRHAQRVLVQLARADALYLADGFVESLSTVFRGVLYMPAGVSPVEPLLEAARPDLAVVAGRWLRERRCHVNVSTEAKDLELEGDWENAALLHELSDSRVTNPERFAAARAADSGGSPDVSAPVALLESQVRLAEERGDHGEAEQRARAGAAAGHGTVLEGLARRRVARGENVDHWRTVLERGLTPDGEPDPGWCETTQARGHLRPMVVDETSGSTVTFARFDGRLEHIHVHAPHTSSPYHWFPPVALMMLVPEQAATFVLTTAAVSLVVALTLLPWLTADARRRWPLRARRLPGLLLSAAFWGPAIVGVLSAAVAERRSPARSLVTVLTAPLSMTAATVFSLLSLWLGTLGGAVMGLAVVYTFLALAYLSRLRNHLHYLIALRPPS